MGFQMARSAMGQTAAASKAAGIPSTAAAVAPAARAGGVLVT